MLVLCNNCDKSKFSVGGSQCYECGRASSYGYNHVLCDECSLKMMKCIHCGIDVDPIDACLNDHSQSNADLYSIQIDNKFIECSKSRYYSGGQTSWKTEKVAKTIFHTKIGDIIRASGIDRKEFLKKLWNSPRLKLIKR